MITIRIGGIDHRDIQKALRISSYPKYCRKNVDFLMEVFFRDSDFELGYLVPKENDWADILGNTRHNIEQEASHFAEVVNLLITHGRVPALRIKYLDSTIILALVIDPETDNCYETVDLDLDIFEWLVLPEPRINEEIELNILFAEFADRFQHVETTLKVVCDRR